MHPDLVAFAHKMAESSPEDWVVVTGIRTQVEVDAKWAEGRSQPGPHAGESGFARLGQTVTNVRDLQQAPHALRQTPQGPYGCAVDLQFIGEKTSLSPGATPEDRAVYLWMGEFAEKSGFTWGGRFARIFDQAHVELKDWKQYPLPPPAQEGPNA